MKILFTIILAIFTNISIGQSGFLGSRTNFQINMCNSLTPLTLKGRTTSVTRYKETRLNLNTSFAFTVNRVINDKIQLGIGYRYAPMVLFSKNIYTEIQDPNNPNNPNIFVNAEAKITNKLRVNHQSAIINLRYFSNGISPIGKGIGLDIEVGRTSIDRLEVDYNTGYEQISSSNGSGLLSDLLNSVLPFSTNGTSKKKYLLNETEDYVDSTTTLLGKSAVNSFVLKGYLGRTIPVSKKIGIDISFTFPLLRIINYNNTNKIGTFIIDKKGETLYETGNATEAIAFSIAKYNGLSLNVGIKYFL
jgi:hypothetical protein